MRRNRYVPTMWLLSPMALHRCRRNYSVREDPLREKLLDDLFVIHDFGFLPVMQMMMHRM